MKKTIIIITVLGLFFAPSFVFGQQQQVGNPNSGQDGQEAQQQGIHEPGVGLEDPELKEATQAQQQGQLQEATQAQQNQSKGEAGRRSRVANAIQNMEMIANRNGGIGDQIRTIARNQNQLQEQAEEALDKAQKRSRFAKFFIGPDYGQLKDIGEKLEMHNKRIEELKELRDDLDSDDEILLDEQIEVMENTAQELLEEASQETRGFSLFGWLNRLLVL